MHALLFGLFVGYFLTACAPVHWSSAQLCVLSIIVVALCLSLKLLNALSLSARVRSPAVFLLQLACGLCTAALALAVSVQQVGARTTSAIEGCGDARLMMRVQVQGLPTTHPAGSRFDALVLDAENKRPGCVELRGKRLRLGSRGTLRLQPGQVLVSEIQLRPIRGSVSAGAYDHELHSAARSVVLGGYVVQAFAVREPASGAMRGLLALDKQRYAVRAAILRQELSHAGVLLALATGDSAKLQSTDWALLRNSGTVHLMVISGLHVGLVSGLIFVLLSWTTGFPASAWLRALLTSAVLFVYVLWVGMGLPAVRAWVMVTVVLLGWAANRPVQPTAILLAAAVGVVFIDPLAGLNVGFWLSFALVGWLLAVPKPADVGPESGGGEKGDARKNSIWCLGRRVFSLHLGATLALFPLLVWLGLPLAPAGPVANLFAVPFVTLVLVPFVLLCLLALAISESLAGYLLAVADTLVGWLFYALELVVGVVDAWSLPAVELNVLVSLFLLVLVMLLANSARLRLSALLVLGLWGWSQIDSEGAPLLRGGIHPGDFVVHMLDVGQGLAVIVRTADAVVLYDTGASFPSGFSFAEAIITPALNRLGVQQLDALVLSHGDNDHAGGKNQIVRVFNPARRAGAVAGSVEFGRCEWRSGAQVSNRWLTAGVELLLLNNSSGVTANNRSCILWIRSPHAEVLLAGDIEADTEQELLDRLPQGVDLLGVAHHGSKTSSTQAFVERLWPGWALVSAGYQNRFGHPHEQVLARFRAIGSTIATTAEAGTLSWHSADVGGMNSARAQRRAQWRLGAPLVLILERGRGL